MSITDVNKARAVYHEKLVTSISDSVVTYQLDDLLDQVDAIVKLFAEADEEGLCRNSRIEHWRNRTYGRLSYTLNILTGNASQNDRDAPICIKQPTICPQRYTDKQLEELFSMNPHGRMEHEEFKELVEEARQPHSHMDAIYRMVELKPDDTLDDDVWCGYIMELIYSGDMVSPVALHESRQRRRGRDMGRGMRHNNVQRTPTRSHRRDYMDDIGQSRNRRIQTPTPPRHESLIPPSLPIGYIGNEVPYIRFCARFVLPRVERIMYKNDIAMYDENDTLIRKNVNDLVSEGDFGIVTYKNAQLICYQLHDQDMLMPVWITSLDDIRISRPIISLKLCNDQELTVISLIRNNIED